jgi:hypothetical protein
MEMQFRSRRFQLMVLVLMAFTAKPTLACEPVVPFMQVMVPTLALSGSMLVLAAAVVLKSVLFAFFERRLPRVRAAWRMFLGNLLTSLIGLLVAVMIASAPSFWLIGAPLVCVFCWLPTRRLVKAAPLPWLARRSPAALAGVMTGAMVVSCILFMAGRGALESHQQAFYWIMKLMAIFLALVASMTLTIVWEEWAIWRLSSRPGGTGFFASVLRTNLYVLIFVMAVPAVLILPKRMKSTDFIAKRQDTGVCQTPATNSSDVKSQ